MTIDRLGQQFCRSVFQVGGGKRERERERAQCTLGYDTLERFMGDPETRLIDALLVKLSLQFARLIFLLIQKRDCPSSRIKPDDALLLASSRCLECTRVWRFGVQEQLQRTVPDKEIVPSQHTTSVHACSNSPTFQPQTDDYSRKREEEFFLRP